MTTNTPSQGTRIQGETTTRITATALSCKRSIKRFAIMCLDSVDSTSRRSSRQLFGDADHEKPGVEILWIPRIVWRCKFDHVRDWHTDGDVRLSQERTHSSSPSVLRSAPLELRGLWTCPCEPAFRKRSCLDALCRDACHSFLCQLAAMYWR